MQTQEWARGRGRGTPERQEQAPGNRSRRRGGMYVSLKSGSSSATGKWKDCKPYTTLDLSAPSGPNSVPLTAAAAAAAAGVAAATAPRPQAAEAGRPLALPSPRARPRKQGFQGLFAHLSVTPPPVPSLTPGFLPNRACAHPSRLAGMATVFFSPFPCPASGLYSASLEPPHLEIHMLLWKS